MTRILRICADERRLESCVSFACFFQPFRAIGKPEYIQFLIDPGQRAFAITRSDKADLLAHPLHWSRLTGGPSFELHSKSLVNSLLGLCEHWQSDRTYRISGAIAPHEDAAVFHVENAIMV